MSRRRKTGRRILLTLLLVILIVVGAAVWFIWPTKDLDLSYHSIDVKGKLLKMVQNRQLEMTLNKEEVTQMSKKHLVKYLRTHNVGAEITGADFEMNGSKMTAFVNGRFGPIPFGAELDFKMSTAGDLLRLEHTSTRIRDVDIPVTLVKLDPVEISLKDYVPDVVRVKEVDFLGDGLKLKFEMALNLFR